ncbi:MAG: ADP-forming succinate--CoA ligase subunit beta [Planctomycetota bacterium]|nr:MAG: ADP-forming succinate--CoA ligase subunit beta [Planctomycetota bacterium]
MKIHEYQAKEVLGRFGVAVPEGRVVTDAAAAGKAYEELGTALCVVKAQIHAGGRGKGGGVKLVRSAAEAVEAAQGMLGKPLITHQTGPEGKVVNTVWIEKGSDIDKEFYLAVTLDRVEQKACVMASREGGMEIEEVAAERPEAIYKEWILPGQGLQGFQARKLAFQLGLEGTAFKNGVKIISQLANAFTQLDCSIAEINPLVLCKDESVIALDAKINFDGNALFRHKDIVEYRDLTEENPKEVEASKFDLSYIALDGNIGCMVNGAGLAMATMDVIKLHGGEPANFLDVGGSATKEQVTEAFKILVSDSNVKALMVNIFGGIAKCDVIAEGVVAAAKEVKLELPLVVRLEGTNVEKGREILEHSGLTIQTASSLDEAADKAVAAAKG